MNKTFPTSLKKVEEFIASVKSWCNNLLNAHDTSKYSHPNGFNKLHSDHNVTIETTGASTEPELILKSNNSRTDPGKGKVAFCNGNGETICGIDCDYCHIDGVDDGFALEVHLAHTPPTAGSSVVVRITNSEKDGMQTFVFGKLYVNGKLIG